MNQPANVTKLHQPEELDNGSESPEVSILKVSINLHKVPKIPEGAGIRAQYDEGYIPEFWDGDLEKLRRVSITPGGQNGHVTRVFETLLKSGELNLTANAMEHLLQAKLPERLIGKMLLLAGTRYGYWKNGMEFVRAICIKDGKLVEAHLAANGAVCEDTYALVLKD